MVSKSPFKVISPISRMGNKNADFNHSENVPEHNVAPSMEAIDHKIYQTIPLIPNLGCSCKGKILIIDDS